jgi:hypothetical protein
MLRLAGERQDFVFGKVVEIFATAEAGEEAGVAATPTTSPVTSESAGLRMT